MRLGAPCMAFLCDPARVFSCLTTLKSGLKGLKGLGGVGNPKQ